MEPDVTQDLLAFLHESPTPFHAVASAIRRLEAARFRHLAETTSWSELPAGRYYTVQGGTALLAFVIPEGRHVNGFRLVGAHTDSPNLRLKPKAEYTKEGYAQLGVEVYGGVLLNSWLDRDLGLAGRVLVRGARGELVPRLVRVDRAVCRVPQLAIHLDREVNDKGLHLNRQEHLAPVFGLAGDGEDVLAMVARELGVERGGIVGSELMLFDITAPTLGGRSGEFIFSARLDNQAMCHASTTALLAAADTCQAGSTVPMAVLFDHEEVGSHTMSGAASGWLPRVLTRIVLGLGGSDDDVHRAVASSFCISADMAHAVHPNYVDRHEARHRPALNGGPVVKVNAQQRYATSAATAAAFEELCRTCDVPVQHFVARTDMPCGSTIGPITSTQLGIPTIDVGNPMLSMHSIREMCGSRDPARMVKVLTHFYAAPALLA